MKFILEIDCGNAAFEDEPLEEIARILQEQAAKMRRFVGDGTKSWGDTLFDINGNKIGFAGLKE